MRSIENLEQNAIKFWPAEIAVQEKDISIIPKLIETQDKFISLLNISDANPFIWKQTLLSTKSMSGNLFLKHLMVLSDIGGESLMRFKKELPPIFGEFLTFNWEGQTFSYKFQTLTLNKSWSNKNLYVDGNGLSKEVSLTPMMEDICMLLLFGGATITNKELPVDIINKCMIGSLLGKTTELELFVKQRYIWVSRITGGATANTLGQLAQIYVKRYLEEKLPEWRINKDHLPDVSQNERTHYLLMSLQNLLKEIIVL